MTITETQAGFEIKFDFHPYKLKSVKAIEGARFNGINKAWYIPKHKEREVEFLKKRFNVVDQAVLQAPEDFEAIPEMPELTINIPLKIPMFPFQARGVAYNLIHKKVIVGDQPGLGKTIQSIATIIGANAFPCLIVCPSTLKINWQREWSKCSDKRAMILTDKVKNTWHQYSKVGMVDVFICNYESLKKYFVEEINKPKDVPLRLNHIAFKDTSSVFKSIILDESHKCFPYETKVLTNEGLLMIGDIVENNRKDLFALSMNPDDKSLTYRSISNVWKNDLSGRSFYKITHSKGVLYATENHEIYTTSGRKKEVSKIQSGEELYLLQQSFSDKQSRENDCPLLLKELRIKNVQLGSSYSLKNGYPQKTSAYRKSLRQLRYNIYNDQAALRSNQEILQSKMLRNMENGNTGSEGAQQDRSKKSGYANQPNKNNVRPKYKATLFRSNENKQSNVQPGYTGKNDSIKQGQNISFQRRQRPINRTSKITSQLSTGCGNGISNLNSIRYWTIQKPSTLLQSRHRHPSLKAGNRSRWTYSPNQKMEVPGLQENGNIEFVRVESVEVYKPTSPEQFGYSSYQSQTVYDIEVSGNHNYFADRILVSNCKDGSTQQSKFAMGIARDKEYILGLTGTPVVNKPKDLIPQLHILGQLVPVFGGYKKFIDRYCEGGAGASNLKELNYILNKNCFYRREKSEVLKDLPAKIRQVMLCEISNRKEYQEAEDNFVQYLKETRGCTDMEVAKKLRGEIMVKMGILKQISSRGKLNEVQDFVNEIIDAGEKIILFCSLREIGDRLKEMYPSAAMIRGGMSSEEKDCAVQKFQKEKTTQVIICSIKAAGVGLTLTASSRVAFIEFPWTFADCEQCEDRAHRIGQKDSVTATYFLGENTIDRYCYDLIQKKKAVAQTITGATDDVEEEVIDQLLNLFNQK